MQFTFGADDGVYTIYKSIQKCSRVHSSIHLTIADTNPLFDHDRWGEQIRTMCEQKGIDLHCTATGPISARYYKRLGIAHTKTENLRTRDKIGSRLWRGRRRFHTKTTYHTFVLLVIEVVGLFFLMRMVVMLLFPSVTITITPETYQDKHDYNFGIYPASAPYTSELMGDRHSVPYYTGSIIQTISARRPIDQQITSQSPAIGTITITNNGNTTFAGLVPQTQWVTERGLIYRTTQRVGAIGPGSSTTVGLYAAATDANGAPMGDNANIPAGTSLSIRKLPETKGIIVGTARDTFTNGSLVSEGRVTQDDIIAIRETLSGNIQTLLTEPVTGDYPDDQIIIPLVSPRGGGADGRPPRGIGTGMAYTRIIDYRLNHNVNDIATSLYGEMDVEVVYPYIRHADLTSVFKAYLAERRSPHTSLLAIDYDRIQITDVIPITSKVSHIGTVFYTTMGYNFLADNNKLIPAIKQTIPGRSLDDAIQEIRQYDDVRDVSITPHPIWYNSIPRLKSRIFVTIKEQ